MEKNDIGKRPLPILRNSLVNVISIKICPKLLGSPGKKENLIIRGKKNQKPIAILYELKTGRNIKPLVIA
jgi:hypothetical protein